MDGIKDAVRIQQEDFSQDEEMLLGEYFENIFDENGYMLFDVRSASEAVPKDVECHLDAELYSEYKDFINWGLSVALYNVDELSEKFEELSVDLDELSKNLGELGDNITEAIQKVYSDITH